MRFPPAPTRLASSSAAIQLERYRQSADREELNLARESLRGVDTTPLDAAERVELTVGLAEALYFEEKYGAAAAAVRIRASAFGASGHARARTGARLVGDCRGPSGADAASLTSGRRIYARVLDRMTDEIAEYPGSAAAGYWLAAAARAGGDVDRAWHAAIAGWLRAPLADDRAPR